MTIANRNQQNKIFHLEIENPVIVRADTRFCLKIEGSEEFLDFSVNRSPLVCLKWTSISMAEGIITDITKISSSIFDHKPQLRKEIEYFVKEFEEKRKESEVDHLFRVLERVTELKDTEIPKTGSLADIHLPKLLGELQVAESISEKLINKLGTAEAKYKEKLEKDREERTKEWDNFVHDMTTRCIKIDSIYKDKQEEVKKLYLKAEEPFTARVSYQKS